MPPVSKAEMMSMVDKWQEVEEQWARENDCAMAVVSAETLDTIRLLLNTHFHKQSCTITLARHGWEEVLYAWRRAQESLQRLAEEFYQGTTYADRKILQQDLLDCLSDVYSGVQEQPLEW